MSIMFAEWHIKALIVKYRIFFYTDFMQICNIRTCILVYNGIEINIQISNANIILLLFILT